MHWIDPLISLFPSVSLSVCQSVCLWTDGSQTIMSTILYQFSRNFVRSSEMRSFCRLLFVRQTGSSLPTLEVCGFRFRQFSGSGDRIFQQMSTKYHIEIAFSNTDFVFNGEWNRKWKSDCTDVQIPDLVSIRYYVHSSLPISAKFFMRLRNAVTSTPVVCETTGSSLPILEVCVYRFRQFLGSGDNIFQQIKTKKILCTDKVQQCRLCIQW